MFNEDNIAAAQIAQLFGSELLRVQENSKTDSGSVPNIVNINPKQFLINSTQQQNSNKKLEEQRMLLALQREAEATHPLQPEVIQSNRIPNEMDEISNNEAAKKHPEISNFTGILNQDEVTKSLASIASSLERLCNVFEKKYDINN
jgi:hypothetical protein